MTPARTWLAGLALACASAFPARAQMMDEQWIIERIVAGRYDELEQLKAESERGSPVAMYWWGLLLEACVYDDCDVGHAREFKIRAARAGNGAALIDLMRRANSRLTFDQVITIRTPQTPRERGIYGSILGLLAGPPKFEGFREAVGIVRDAAAAEPSMELLAMIGGMEGYSGEHFDELSAMVEAGFEEQSENLLRQWMVRRHLNRDDVMASAARGDRLSGLVMCNTLLLAGQPALRPELLPICERRLMEGYLSVAAVLLRHYAAAGEMRTAQFYADLCARLPTPFCGYELAMFYEARGPSRAWKIWDAVAGVGLTVPWSKTGLPRDIQREAFSLSVRNSTSREACLARRYDVATQKFKESPTCPWLKPIAIPAEFLSHPARGR